jgi:hypothetical protein
MHGRHQHKYRYAYQYQHLVVTQQRCLEDKIVRTQCRLYPERFNEWFTPILYNIAFTRRRLGDRWGDARWVMITIMCMGNIERLQLIQAAYCKPLD